MRSPCSALNKPIPSRLPQSIICRPSSAFNCLRVCGTDHNSPQPSIQNKRRLDNWPMDFGSFVNDGHSRILRNSKLVSAPKESGKVTSLLHLCRDRSVRSLSRPMEFGSSLTFSQSHKPSSFRVVNSPMVSGSLVMDGHSLK
ncbi:hypothetical protein M758_9G095800 [Ceratodon purpureus]|nr:hypothetical protein M758_9G095800 [Ceratodon purpureus]